VTVSIFRDVKQAVAARREQADRVEVFERLDRALAAASDQATHRRVSPAQPMAELYDHDEYTAWREDHLRRMPPGLIIPEPQVDRMALVLFVLRPSVVERWLRGEHVSSVTAPLVVFPPGPEGAEPALAAACAAWLDQAQEGYELAPPMLRRHGAGPFELADLERNWPGERARAVSSRLAERPLRARPTSRRPRRR
jgi:hypothetical protein